ncbi:MAG: hypothetical protein QMD13_00010 [Candidatus Bathyarchaeia archaeon]|nr:hypothetical protein [Candidatus Bathyarchaeia archaeon]
MYGTKLGLELVLAKYQRLLGHEAQVIKRYGFDPMVLTNFTIQDALMYRHGDFIKSPGPWLKISIYCISIARTSYA